MLILPPDNQCHAGLLLDKWHKFWPVLPDTHHRSSSRADQDRDRAAKREFDEFARSQLERVTRTARDQVLLDHLRRRFQRALANSPSLQWKRRTSGALTLHLSRAGSFENAGICLHPIYGWAYLPGTGLKGMARAYARNVARAASAEIEEVFGKDVTTEENGSAGAVVFYDAVPVRWPELTVDIVNNHHRRYYESGEAPEDWEDPVPINFLSLAPGQEFEFSIAVRVEVEGGNRVLKLAQSWVDGALAWLGAGAKTNAGYGRFATGATLDTVSERREFTAAIRFVSPAFLAGALQARSDCVLRPATVRGLLRSWWRTLHSGFLPLEELRNLEGELWGTTTADGAINLHVEPIASPQVQQFSFRKPRDIEAIPGRFYLGYGMEGNPASNKPARWFAEPGAGWKITIVARSTPSWSSEISLDQAVTSLWLLSEFGGIGAKCRRGFGSFELTEATVPLPNAKDVFARASRARPRVQYTESLVQSPTLKNLTFRVLPLKTREVWSAIDRLGEAYRSFTASEKRKPEKLALGLPRSIGRRNLDQQPLRHPAGQHPRHASPLLFRLVSGSDGYSVRITTLPSPHLPNLQRSREYLKRCSDFIAQQLLGRG